VEFVGDGIIKRSLESNLSTTLGTDVKIQSLEVNYLGGGAEIEKLEIQNKNFPGKLLIIDEVGYPVLMAIGMGYFIWYVWKYVTKELKPKISASHKTLIKLLDQIRMLDNDLIRLQQKVNTVIEYRKQEELKKQGQEDENSTVYINNMGKSNDNK